MYSRWETLDPSLKLPIRIVRQNSILGLCDSQPLGRKEDTEEEPESGCLGLRSLQGANPVLSKKDTNTSSAQRTAMVVWKQTVPWQRKCGKVRAGRRF